MTQFAICLVTDDKYMLPTVVAAAQARAAVGGSDVDVFVFAVGLSEAAAAAYGAICAEAGVKLSLVARDIFGGDTENEFIDAFFRDSTFTFGALGRLFLDQLLPASYQQILYIDGDIQIAGSIADLVRMETPSGRFLAAPDPKVFWIDDDSPTADLERRYMDGLGIGAAGYGQYFNSGILRIDRSGWRDIGLEAWRFLQSSPDLCVCHDQSALNAAGRDRRLPMSLKWNFPAYWRFYGLQHQLNPAITHFMSRPKPWNGAFLPWGQAEHAVYTDFVARHPETAGDLARFDFKRQLRYKLQQSWKFADETLHTGRRARVRRGVLSYEAQILS